MFGWLQPAVAQTYPSRPVTIVVPFGAGSATDSAARMLAAHLDSALGQRFVVENKAGAGGTLAANFVARAEPDGYTLLLTTNTTHSAAHGLFKNVPYDPLKDFTAVARVGSFPSMVVANPNEPFKTIQDLVAYAKANPGKLEYAHGNSTGQVAGETLKRRTGIEVVRVPYRSNPPAVLDVATGRVATMIADFTTALPQVRDGKIRPLAVLTKTRSSILPDVVTLHETVAPEFDLIAWAGLFGPANLPGDVVQTLAKEVKAFVEKPENRAKLEANGIEAFYLPPAEFKAYVADELVKWTTAIKEAGIEPQ
ncbi:tripartite tricarboxylate transporter substrate binding protein [Enterovirga sp. DB1703]|uniref:Tripartite tricarboxylate transporter substrate binding protein n=2 Tax=Enterovirga aerilata TaxID=2730920 RepID=A0A849I961_9HYPH|nr:tripartite tricarboxylate transporter substrate binding protein [Enterovirga sp. DB1703]